MMRWALLFLFLIGAAASGHAQGDRIWAALVVATRETPPQPVPRSLEQIAPTLEKVFGYNSFAVLGEKKRQLWAGGEEWLVPSKEFFFKVQCLSRDKTSYQVRIELYRGKTLMVTTEARLARDAPLYIKGPQWGRKQLIFILKVL